ncbi:hypothetical protein PSH03_003659 [Micromonospora sp. PSH03]|uniref:hypothetical protein n=1 Tax=Micromonospora salmantinae TaxID=2911211 RepID=UPI001EE8AD14|nr:hypothetical protein [Micromonospora salmantinae]MCG5454501.1 hypothetical protein [Micromonospora salmantinae]
MDTIDDPHALRILREAGETLRAIGRRKLAPSDWDAFDSAVRRMQAALDRGDLLEVRDIRSKIDMRFPRQRARASLATVEQPARTRTASENLSRAIAERLAKVGRDADEPRR